MERMGDSRIAYVVWVGHLRVKDQLEDLGVEGKMILNGSSRSGMKWHGLDWSEVGQGEGRNCCICGIELLLSIECGYF